MMPCDLPILAYFGVQAKSWQYQLSAIFVPSRRVIAFPKLILKLHCTSKMCPGKQACRHVLRVLPIAER
jgi:hypothetical protein